MQQKIYTAHHIIFVLGEKRYNDIQLLGVFPAA